MCREGWRAGDMWGSWLFEAVKVSLIQRWCNRGNKTQTLQLLHTHTAPIVYVCLLVGWFLCLCSVCVCVCTSVWHQCINACHKAWGGDSGAYICRHVSVVGSLIYIPAPVPSLAFVPQQRALPPAAAERPMEVCGWGRLEGRRGEERKQRSEIGRKWRERGEVEDEEEEAEERRANSDMKRWREKGEVGGKNKSKGRKNKSIIKRRWREGKSQGWKKRWKEKEVLVCDEKMRRERNEMNAEPMEGTRTDWREGNVLLTNGKWKGRNWWWTIRRINECRNIIDTRWRMLCWTFNRKRNMPRIKLNNSAWERNMEEI